jgi:ATP-binding cassette subfamily C protein CydD/ATP-binding cassette subfamily C protein CydCD
VAQGTATIATAFALSSLVVAVVDGMPLGRPAAYLLALFTVRGALAFLGERVAADSGATVSAALRERLLARWLASPADERPEPATAVTLAAQGAASVEPYVARFLPALVTAAVVPALAVVVLALVDWLSALIVVLTLPLLPLFAALIGASTRDATQRRWAALAGLSGHFLDVMRGLPTLVSYGRAGRQVASIGEVSQRHRRATMATLRLAFLSSAALELLATICVALVAVTVGLRLTQGSMELGTALVAILLAPEAYWPIRRVGAEFHSASDGAQALSVMTDGLATPAGTAGGAGALATKPAEPPLARVEAQGLGYSYPRSPRRVVDGLDLVAGVGLTVLTGASGVGKTTVLELLAGLRVPDTGSVVAPRAHLVTQRPFLTVGSIRENLTLGLAHPPPTDALWAALRDVGLEGAVAGVAGGLDGPLGDDGRGLSAGQRARLVLARATLDDATVLLLDEPTAHLDEVSAGLAHAVVQALAERRCVLVVTHRPELVALADAHVHLTAPEVAATGSHPRNGGCADNPGAISPGSHSQPPVRGEGSTP